jgi:GT2 family glycosyltransferase
MRPRALRLCAQALAAQETQPDEILVVARSDDAETLELVADLAMDCMELIQIDLPAGRPGVVKALNAGTSVATGDVVCLTDDDAEPHRDWLTRVVAAFDTDPAIGAVGGRDWVYHDGELEEGECLVVGTVSRIGRLTGNHHLGVGPAREVEVLKGVNLSVRGDLVREIGFDERLLARATEHHWELALCLRLRRLGYRVIYDPSIAVDHRPRARVQEDRVRNARDVHDAAHNESLALLEHLSPVGGAAHMAWALGVGTRAVPGLAASTRLAVTTGSPQLDLFKANLRGRMRAYRTYRSR